MSYKEAKHLARYHGESIFKGLVTATNEVGEIRVQFHVVTDGFDQFEGPLDAFHATLVAYGHALTCLLGTDNPARDAAYFLNKLPGLRAKQAELDAITNNSGTAGSPSAGGPAAGGSPPNVYFTIDDPSRVELISTVAAINSKVATLHAHVVVVVVMLATRPNTTHPHPHSPSHLTPPHPRTPLPPRSAPPHL